MNHFSKKWRFSIFLSLSITVAVLVAAVMARRNQEAAAIIPHDMLAAADASVGLEIAKGCTACHSITKGAAHKLGPNLFGIVGARIADHPDYQYSSALKAKNNQLWTTDALYEWLRDPSEFAPGTKMSFVGILDPQDRMDLIAYLMTLK